MGKALPWPFLCAWQPAIPALWPASYSLPPRDALMVYASCWGLRCGLPLGSSAAVRTKVSQCLGSDTGHSPLGTSNGILGSSSMTIIIILSEGQARRQRW